MALAVTESSHEKSINIDIASPSEIVRTIEETDGEIFSGWNKSQGLNDLGLHSLLQNIAELAVNILEDPVHNSIVLSGCGTSGRLAFVVVNAFNHKLKEYGLNGCFHYLIAGNDSALLRSKELQEDDPKLGAEDLEKLCRNKNKVLYIGITCGFSAPYIAGQLDHCMKNLSKYIPVLMGFNYSTQARNLPIENWNKTFRDVVLEMEYLMKDKQKLVFIVNPVVGPEPVTGSTRMKSGTTTYILLNVIFGTAFLKLQKSADIDVAEVIDSYRSAYRLAYQSDNSLAMLVEFAA